MYVFRQRLIDIYKQNWNARLTESPRARFYRVVISDLSFDEQLDKIHNKSHRNAWLRVETGRWERPVIPYESRICTMCHKLDDEFHFLLECPRYHDIRRQYLPTYFRVRPSMFKCIELLNTNNDKTVRSLAKYVFEAFRVRSLSVSWYVHVICVMHWLRRGAVAVAIAGRWLHPWMSLRHSRRQTVTACGRHDRLPLPSA